MNSKETRYWNLCKGIGTHLLTILTWATKIWGGNEAEETWGLLGIEDSYFVNLKIYPTITHDRLYISNITNKDIDIVIYNISGQQITVPIYNDNIEVRQLNDGEKSKSFKFIKN